MERVIEINLLGVMYTDRAALPHLEQSRGYLLNTGIVAASVVALGLLLSRAFTARDRSAAPGRAARRPAG